MSKILGYIVSLVGILAITLTVKPAKQAILKIVPITIPAQLTNLYLTIGGLVLLIVGILIIMRGGGRRGRKGGEEVPIYQGKRIVGYRRG